MNMMTHYKAGQKARYEGFPRSANPWNFGYGPTEAWENGWLDYDKYMKEKR